jgi:hypothetical protein
MIPRKDRLRAFGKRVAGMPGHYGPAALGIVAAAALLGAFLTDRRAAQISGVEPLVIALLAALLVGAAAMLRQTRRLAEKTRALDDAYRRFGAALDNMSQGCAGSTVTRSCSSPTPAIARSTD